MFRPRLAITLLLLLPSLAVAQRKGKMGAGDKGPEWDSMQKDASMGLKLSNKDLEGASPIKLLMDRKKDLKLSDDVLKQLKDIDTKDKDTNKDLFKKLDSLRGETKPSGVDVSDADKYRAQLAMSVAETVVKDIRTNYAASLQTAMPLLDDTQKTMANDLVQKQLKETDSMLRDKMGTRAAADGDASAGGGKSRGGRPPSF